MGDDAAATVSHGSQERTGGLGPGSDAVAGPGDPLVDRIAGAAARSRALAALCSLAFALTGAPADAQVWEVRNWASSGESPEANDHYGFSVAIGDIDANAHDDLLVGRPDLDYIPPPPDPPLVDSGNIDLTFGDDAGVAPPFLAGLLPFVLTAGKRFGATIAIADFDSTAFNEFAIGAPGESSVAAEAGEVEVRYYQAPGTFAAQRLVPGTFGLPGTSEPFDHFGEVLAVGHFDDDGYWDLAIGTPGENLESPALALDAGEVTIIYGSAIGLDPSTAHLINENTGTLGGAQASARFGSALAAADFDGDGYHDLAVGIPDRDVMAGTLQADAGEVVILFGSAGGLTTTGHQRLNAASLSLGVAAGQRFGAALGAGDFDLTLLCLFVTCYADLAIGVPGWLDLGHPESGMVAVLDGGAAGLDVSSVGFLFQDVLLDGGSAPEDFDRFGSVLQVASLDGRIGADLAIGVPEQDVGANADQGMVHLVFGGPGGLRSYPGQFLVQRPGLGSGPGGAFDHFGAALDAGDFDDDGHPDLAVGIPGYNAPGLLDAGMIQVLYGALFADGFESGGTSYWD